MKAEEEVAYEEIANILRKKHGLILSHDEVSFILKDEVIVNFLRESMSEEKTAEPRLES